VNIFLENTASQVVTLASLVINLLQPLSAAMQAADGGAATDPALPAAPTTPHWQLAGKAPIKVSASCRKNASLVCS
jgi:hypothetical protein